MLSFFANYFISFKIYSYNGMWYAAPLHTQKMLLFIMQEGMVDITIKCGGIFAASLEGFAAVKLKAFFKTNYNVELTDLSSSLIIRILFSSRMPQYPTSQ